ncbi:MAG TPA: hypothetical protein PL069_02025 [Saprospiraceae bacterium]|nr:hypothetical protein [Saprospiraceae bacterium]
MDMKIGRLWESVLFGNYLVGTLAVGLCIETAFQVSLPFAAWSDYLIIFFLPIAYYTYAYLKVGKEAPDENPRSRYYVRNAKVLWQWEVGMMGIVLLATFIPLISGKFYLSNISWPWYLLSGTTFCMALFYYGLISRKYFGFDIRQSHWLKSFIIGWVWGYFSTALPVIFLNARGISIDLDIYLWLWFFIKNWMFCTVNSIMFDIKDYPTDLNARLRTFVVSFGIRRTIYRILFPLLLAGMISFSLFAREMNFSLARYLFNLLPFLATMAIAFSMLRPRSIFFYLVIIDGVLIFKALCGIIGALL